MRLVIAALGATLALSGSAIAADFSDDFEGGVNDAAWAWIRGGDTLENTGGNPGWWLHQPTYDTFAPILESAFNGGTPFTSDYRAIIVTGISADFRTDALNFGDGTGFPLVLVLRDANGTPADITDDDFVYFVGPNIPTVGQGWVSYDFDIDSLADDLPAGWKGGWIGDCETLRPGVTYEDVMSSVDRVEFWYLDPCYAAAFQQWDVGVDNLEIRYDGGSTPTEEKSWGAVKAQYRD